MIEKRWLKNIAAGLLDSFVSRNNDFIGYWVLGVLYTETLAYGKRVDIDLLAASADPATPAAVAAACFWSDYLRAALQRHRGAVGDLEMATVSITFGCSPLPQPRHHMCGGDPFACSLRLLSRSGDVADREALGFCFPHLSHDGRRSTRYPA